MREDISTGVRAVLRQFGNSHWWLNRAWARVSERVCCTTSWRSLGNIRRAVSKTARRRG